MKKIILSALFLTFSLGLLAQISLTYKNNALVTGDVNVYREIQYTDPGNAGSNQIWDFSKIQYTGKSPESNIQPNASKPLSGVSDYNLILNENGYEYFINLNENGIEEKGFINKEKEMTLLYSDPIVKMKYPFSFGEQFSNAFTGIASYREISRIDVSGNYSVVADAFGTLVFPDRVIKNALRLKITRDGLDRNMCGSTVSNSVRYSWYAPGMRYPVLSISSIEYQTSSQVPSITRTAFVNLEQKDEANKIAGSDESQVQADKSDVSVILFPNPFNEKISYNYYLRKQLPVSIELFDMTGSSKLRIIKDQVQSEGLHSGELDGTAIGLTPGIYYIRFTFDKKVVVSKIVKI
jgi:hypothetical protein